MTTQGPCLEVQGLSVYYGDKEAIRDIDLSLPEGKIIGIMGPNGSGKTTLLKCMTGLLKPSSGGIKAFGKPLISQRSQISYIPQKDQVDWDFPLSIRDLVQMSLYRHVRWYQKLSDKLIKKGDEAIDSMGLTDIQHTQIGELSGGQQQRAFIARALASNANILLLDEPFTGIDAKTTDDLIRIFQTLKNEGKTIVLVHHDLANAKSFLDHVVLLKKTVLKSGEASDVLNSPELFKAYGFSFQPCRN
jgi:ABC-type Mn2+/Zn2+ transport system ATPase subunit